MKPYIESNNNKLHLTTIKRTQKIAFSSLFTALLCLFLLPVSLQAEGQIKDFNFVDLNGKSHKYSDYSGRWIIVNYWATYCSPCLEEIPDLVEFTKTNRHRATVLGFDAGGEDADTLRSFSAEHGINYPVVEAQSETLTAFGKITAIPTSFIISPEGEMVAKVIGVLDVHKIERLMDAYEGFTPESTNPSQPDDSYDFDA